jgi:hypothetical protein
LDRDRSRGMVGPTDCAKPGRSGAVSPVRAVWPRSTHLHSNRLTKAIGPKEAFLRTTASKERQKRISYANEGNQWARAMQGAARNSE